MRASLSLSLSLSLFLDSSFSFHFAWKVRVNAWACTSVPPVGEHASFLTSVALWLPFREKRPLLSFLLLFLPSPPPCFVSRFFFLGRRARPREQRFPRAGTNKNFSGRWRARKAQQVEPELKGVSRKKYWELRERVDKVSFLLISLFLHLVSPSRSWLLGHFASAVSFSVSVCERNGRENAFAFNSQFPCEHLSCATSFLLSRNIFFLLLAVRGGSQEDDGRRFAFGRVAGCIFFDSPIQSD